MTFCGHQRRLAERTQFGVKCLCFFSRLRDGADFAVGAGGASGFAGGQAIGFDLWLAWDGGNLRLGSGWGMHAAGRVLLSAKHDRAGVSTGQRVHVVDGMRDGSFKTVELEAGRIGRSQLRWPKRQPALGRSARVDQ